MQRLTCTYKATPDKYLQASLPIDRDINLLGYVRSSFDIWTLFCSTDEYSIDRQLISITLKNSKLAVLSLLTAKTNLETIIDSFFYASSTRTPCVERAETARETYGCPPYEHENSGKNRDNDPQLSTPRRSVKMGKSYGTRGGNSCVLLSHAD